jgi:hypothetical protein
VRNRPSAYLDNIDAIDGEKAEDLIYDEIEDQQRRDYPRPREPERREKKQPLPTRNQLNRLWEKVKKRTITDHKKRERAGEIKCQT